jgi:chaperonin GroES
MTNKIQIQPLGSRVLVRPLEAEKVTNGGIFIPETAKEKPQTGEVVAVSDDKEEIKVKVGQKVMFPKYNGTEIKIDGVEHIIIEAEDLLAIVLD